MANMVVKWVSGNLVWCRDLDKVEAPKRYTTFNYLLRK